MALALSKLDAATLGALHTQAPRWVAALLLAGVGARLAWWVTDWLAAPPADALAPVVAADPQAGGAHLNLQAIQAAQLFGAAAASKADAQAAPVSRAALVLAGVVADADPQRGLALVGTSAADARVVRVGGALPSGGTLAQVHRDRILIDTGAGLEAVLLPRQSAPVAAPAGTAPAPTEPPASLGALIQQAPDLIPGVIRPQMVVEGGRQLGFRAYPGPNRQAFDKLGLRPGDLVTAINGTPLSDPAVGKELFANLGSAAVARVTVSREGRNQDITLNLAQVQADLRATPTPPAGNAP